MAKIINVNAEGKPTLSTGRAKNYFSSRFVKVFSIHFAKYKARAAYLLANRSGRKNLNARSNFINAGTLDLVDQRVIRAEFDPDFVSRLCKSLITQRDRLRIMGIMLTSDRKRRSSRLFHLGAPGAWSRILFSGMRGIGLDGGVIYFLARYLSNSFLGPHRLPSGGSPAPPQTPTLNRWYPFTYALRTLKFQLSEGGPR